MSVKSDDRIFEVVRHCLVEALDVEEGEVTEAASLVDDLEAESIDFVDIVFRLEKAFEVKIPLDSLFPNDLLSNKEFVQNGVLTRAGIEALKERNPNLSLPGGDKDITVFELSRLYDVGMLVRFIKEKVSGNE